MFTTSAPPIRFKLRQIPESKPIPRTYPDAAVLNRAVFILKIIGLYELKFLKCALFDPDRIKNKKVCSIGLDLA